jgi:outer membrane biosynthesis protein TonB
MRVALLAVLVACGGSRASSPPVAPAPARVAAKPASPPPAPPPDLPAPTPPADGATVVARGGDPCEGGELTQPDAGGLAVTGAGGGGTGEGTIGLGTIGTIGHGSGTGSGYGIGGRGHREPTVKTGPPQSSAGLDKAIIRRVIRRNLAKFRYCYEKELANTPELAGRLVTKFTIGPGGNVTGARVVTGLGTNVDTCVTNVLLGLMFPKPSNGASIEVSYPFVFSPQ